MLRIHFHDAEVDGICQWHIDAGHGGISIIGHMLGEHDRVVHLVDMVTCQDQHILGSCFAHEVEVLEDGVGCSAVPVLTQPLLGRDHVDVFAHVRGQKPPAAFDMANQAL